LRELASAGMPVGDLVPSLRRPQGSTHAKPKLKPKPKATEIGRDLRGRAHLFGPILTAQIYTARRNKAPNKPQQQPLRFTAAEQKSLEALAASIYKKRAQRRAAMWS
jgi:hypothetical protein